MFFFHHFWSLSRKSGAFSRKTLAMLLNLCFTSPKRYFDENYFFIEKLFSRTLLDKGQIYPGFLAKTFRQCCQNFILSVHRKFSGNKKFEKKILFFSVILGQEAKKLSARGEVFSARLSKLQSTCPKKSFREIFSFQKNENFLNVSWQWLKNHRHLARIFFLLLGCQNCNLSFYRNNLCFFRILPLQVSSMDLEQKNPESWQKLFGTFVDTAFYIFIGTVWGKKLDFFKYVRHSWTPSKKKFGLCNNFSGRSARSAF